MEFWLRASAPVNPERASTRAVNLSLLGKLLCVAAVLAVFGAEYIRWSRAAQQAPARIQLAPVQAGKASFTPRSHSLLPMPPNVPSAHSSVMTPLPDGGVAAFWWAGSREGGADVKVYSAHWQEGKWSEPWVVASRESLGEGLGYGVRRIGNPVAWTSADGRLDLFVVTTGMGGWATSRLVQLVSRDLGKTFKVKRLLPMSPLFNTSVLVRNSPVSLADGGWLLPTYFEIGIKYPMMIAFDQHGDPRWVSRIGSRITTLQPAVVPVSSSEVHAWMRDASNEQRIQHARSTDAGENWDDLPALDLPNQGTSLSALRLSNGSVVLLHNHVVPGGSDRSTLRLSISEDGRSWTRVTDIEQGKAGEEFSYPDLHQVGKELHITYTSRRQAIAHHVYTLAFGAQPQ
jgi:predicted neuraminidase